jgi:hypothetical protein
LYSNIKLNIATNAKCKIRQKVQSANAHGEQEQASPVVSCSSLATPVLLALVVISK